MRLRLVSAFGAVGLCIALSEMATVTASVFGGYDFWLAGQLIAQGQYSHPRFSLNGGYKQHTNEYIACATFTHNAGTNRVLGRVHMSSMEPTFYILHSGLLHAESIIMDPIGHPCRLQQFGGMARVNQLIMHTYRGRDFLQSIYTMEWGELEVRDVTLRDTVLFEHKNGTVRHTGVLTMAGGTWQTKPGSQELGPVVVTRSAYGSSNSTVSMPAASAIVRFADSRAQNWETGTTLFIRNWDGSPNGGGDHQVFFGDGSGITTQQLAQVRFVNVVGQLPGVFPPKQVETGEIVPVIGPDEPPVLRLTSRSSSYIYLQWPVGYTLQSATNAAGPFEDMWRPYHSPPNSSGAASEWCYPFEQMRVYRLRK